MSMTLLMNESISLLSVNDAKKTLLSAMVRFSCVLRLGVSKVRIGSKSVYLRHVV